MSLIRNAILRSLIVGATAFSSAGGASAATIFSDNFDGPGNVAGNAVPGWTSYEANSGGVSLINYGCTHNFGDGFDRSAEWTARRGGSGRHYLDRRLHQHHHQLRLAAQRHESDDAFYFSYIVNPGTLNTALMQNEGAWTTTLISAGGPDTNWATINYHPCQPGQRIQF